LINEVKISSEAMKHLRKVPSPISMKFRRWVTSVQKVGLLEVRKVPAYHDEPLKGKWKGYRSIRLNKAYRAFYRLEEGTVTFVVVERVNKHEY